MVANLISFIIGIIACAAYDFIRAFFIIEGKLILGGYPPVAGKYKSIYGKKGEEIEEIMEMKQFGKKIWGTFVEKNHNYELKFNGTISPTRVITVNFHQKGYLADDRGAGLLRLNPNGNAASGYTVFLNDGNGLPEYAEMYIEKI